MTPVAARIGASGEGLIQTLCEHGAGFREELSEMRDDPFCLAPGFLRALLVVYGFERGGEFLPHPAGIEREDIAPEAGYASLPV